MSGKAYLPILFYFFISIMCMTPFIGFDDGLLNYNDDVCRISDDLCRIHGQDSKHPDMKIHCYSYKENKKLYKCRMKKIHFILNNICNSILKSIMSQTANLSQELDQVFKNGHEKAIAILLRELNILNRMLESGIGSIMFDIANKTESMLNAATLAMDKSIRLIQGDAEKKLQTKLKELGTKGDKEIISYIKDTSSNGALADFTNLLKSASDADANAVNRTMTELILREKKLITNETDNACSTVSTLFKSFQKKIIVEGNLYGEECVKLINEIIEKNLKDVYSMIQQIVNRDSTCVLMVIKKTIEKLMGWSKKQNDRRLQNRKRYTKI